MKAAIVLASSNSHKIEELREILSDYQILSMKDVGFEGDIVEDGQSFEENALIKARAIHKMTGKTVIADDSGLCVDALGGDPGIYSARYAGEPCNDQNNNNKLLHEMDDISESDRTAYFVSAAAVVFEDGRESVERGEVSGRIGYKEIGTNGFGYDPLFICDETDLRYAQMSSEQKNKISHRKRAFSLLKPTIDAYYSDQS